MIPALAVIEIIMLITREKGEDFIMHTKRKCAVLFRADKTCVVLLPFKELGRSLANSVPIAVASTQTLLG
eukprot:3293771-Ditylum_brightwellii.AAC.1